MRKSEHNLNRDDIWQNSLSTSFINTLQKTHNLMLSQQTFGSDLLDDNNSYKNWEKARSESCEYLKSLKEELKISSADLPQSFKINFPTQEKEKFYEKYEKLKVSLEKLPEKFEPLDNEVAICSIKEAFKILESIVSLSLTSKKDIYDKFDKKRLEKLPRNKLSRTTFKDNLSKKASDKVVLNMLAFILSLFNPKEANFNILTEEFTQNLSKIINDINTENLSQKDINTEYFIRINDYLQESIKYDIPFSDEIIHLIIFNFSINHTYNKINSVISNCQKTLKAIRPFIKYYNKYNDNIDETFLKQISSLFLNLPVDKASLDNLEKKWKSLSENLTYTKDQLIIEYRRLLPQIVLENEYSEGMLNDYELYMITQDIITSLQKNGKDFNKYYAFVSNFKADNNFDKICNIIDSLSSMKKEISDSFIKLFMNKIQVKAELENIKVNVTVDDIKKLVNRTNLSGDKLEVLTNILFFDLSDEEWSFLFHLPLIEIEEKEWFETFYNMLKNY